jgi:KTSC domain
MELIPVDSSSVRRVGYEEDLQILYVQFIDGEVYEYREVPADDFIELLHAESIGWFVNKRIKPYYDYRRLHAAS